MAVEKHVECGPVFPEVSTGLDGWDRSSLFSTNWSNGEKVWGYWANPSPPHFHTLYYY